MRTPIPVPVSNNQDDVSSQNNVNRSTSLREGQNLASIFDVLLSCRMKLERDHDVIRHSPRLHRGHVQIGTQRFSAIIESSTCEWDGNMNGIFANDKERTSQPQPPGAQATLDVSIERQL